MNAEIIVFITGAKRGLGFETAKKLLVEKRYHVIVGSRNAADGVTAVKTLQGRPDTRGRVSNVTIDVTEDSSVEAARSHIESAFGRLDILVHHAVIYKFHPLSPESPLVEIDDLRDSFETNVVGVARVTEALLPLLRRSNSRPRLVFVSSSMASLMHNGEADSPHGGTHAPEYRASKAAFNMLLVQYRMFARDITGIGVDPRFCSTDVTGDTAATRKMGAAEPEVGARVITSVVKGEKDDVPGRVGCEKPSTLKSRTIG
ncbi:hypothetical protein N7456_000398 [Penicillium angulare]|uniref:Short-chain dehydrogenase/reductase SDR n=1 Tax=Penicillium angulare TaxID=116970 RepID=A0A9W9GCX4_9EURO|nr:hypothetical protein N7456_000398 [Penicillium angulare]